MNSPEFTSSETVPELPPDFGRHNMVVFGRDTVFLSHLPMFMAPHDAQLILEVALENADGSSLQEAWSRERESHLDEHLYTMMPEKFALSTLYAADPPERGSFWARFFRGHLERASVGPGLRCRGGVSPGSPGIMAWYDADPSRQVIDSAMDATMDQLVAAHRGTERA
jgi:hypothetical protein